MTIAEARRRHRPAAPPRSPAQGGYVLITVLAALALLAVVAARLDARVANFWEATDRWGRWHAAEREAISAREQLLYSLATRAISPMGFGSGATLVRVDGRPYRLASGTLVSIQDLRGLLSVTATGQPAMRAWLRQQGLDDRAAERLMDALADYADADTLRRLNGAEAAEYAAAGLPPPRNEWLVSVHELRAVLGWHDRPALVEAAAEELTAVREGWINPNTAPPALLLALPGATPQAVQQLLALREQRHLATAAELAAASGIVLPDDDTLFYPGLFYRLRLWHPGSPRAAEYTVMFAPESPLQPWLVLETRQIPRPAWAVDSGEARPAAPPGRPAGREPDDFFRARPQPPSPADVTPFPLDNGPQAAAPAQTP